ncbi:hypothetical protein AB0J21_15990 [Streptomyces sp. NPDC049954]|uniref:hypothetical protein n=1 Tax=Streptomyces sp. NPDC049954 TaxID=3155779 RepID=UPI00342CFCB7
MTYTPGLEGPGAGGGTGTGKPPSNSVLADLDKPQGLQSSPHIPNPDYPHLGFHPVPGDTETVAALRRKVTGAARTLSETHDLVSRLMDGGYWKGDAAVAFREQIDGGPLPLNLKNAARSLSKAAKQLGLWETELEEFRRRAKKLDGEAEDARAALAEAKGRADTAREDPDLDRKGTRHDSAKKDLKRAESSADDVQDVLDGILRRAKDLATEHEEKARLRARGISEATHKLAPHEPGWLEDLGSWISENLPDILSFVAGVVGLVALFVVTGGTAAAVLLLAAAAMSAGALALRLSDPAVLASLKDGFANGEFDSDFWGNAVSVGGDVLGFLPGAGAAGKGITGAANVLRRGEEVLSLGQRLSLFGSQTMNEARSISGLGNPLLERFVRGARNPAALGEALETVSGGLGVVTAGYGLVSSAVDAVDNDTAKDVTTGVDGSRGVMDAGALLDLVRHLAGT